MDGDGVVKRLIITGVKFTDRELGRGKYGRVFAVDYNGVKCAAKEFHPFLLKIATVADRPKLKQNFLRELLHSRLH